MASGTVPRKDSYIARKSDFTVTMQQSNTLHEEVTQWSSIQVLHLTPRLTGVSAKPRNLSLVAIVRYYDVQ
jgi:hypothetical protein